MACNRKDAVQKKAVKVMLLDHEESGINWITMSTMTMTAMRARKRVRRRARRRASRVMVRSSRAPTARGMRRRMLLLISLCARQ